MPQEEKIPAKDNPGPSDKEVEDLYDSSGLESLWTLYPYRRQKLCDIHAKRSLSKQQVPAVLLDDPEFFFHMLHSISKSPDPQRLIPFITHFMEKRVSKEELPFLIQVCNSFLTKPYVFNDQASFRWVDGNIELNLLFEVAFLGFGSQPSDEECKEYWRFLLLMQQQRGENFLWSIESAVKFANLLAQRGNGLPVLCTAKLGVIIPLRHYCNDFYDTSLSSWLPYPDILSFLLIEGSQSDVRIKKFFAASPRNLYGNFFQCFPKMYNKKLKIVEPELDLTVRGILLPEPITQLILQYVSICNNIKSTVAAHYAVLFAKCYEAIYGVAKDNPCMSVLLHMQDNDPPGSIYLRLRLVQLILQKNYSPDAIQLQLVENALALCDKNAGFLHAEVRTQSITTTNMEQIFYNAGREGDACKALLDIAQSYLIVLKNYYESRKEQEHMDDIPDWDNNSDLIENQRSFIESCRLFLNPEQVEILYSAWGLKASPVTIHLPTQLALSGYPHGHEEKKRISWAFDLFRHPLDGPRPSSILVVDVVRQKYVM